MNELKKLKEEFDKEFIKDLGLEVEPIFIDPIGCVGPVRVFIEKAYKAGRESLKKELLEKVEKFYCECGYGRTTWEGHLANCQGLTEKEKGYNRAHDEITTIINEL